MMLFIGQRFNAMQNFPLGLGPYEDEDVSLDAHKGEVLEIIEYDESKDEYKLRNISMAHPEAWFIVSQQQLLILGGRP